MKDVSWGVIHGEGTIVCKCDRCGRKEEYPFESGNQYAQYRLGKMCLLGDGVPKDIERTVQLLSVSANQGKRP